MTRPLILHAGFHKTGTSSLQQTLKTNRGALKTHCNLVLKFRLKELLHATRGYSTWRDPLSLAKLAHRADTWLADQPDYMHRGLIASAEEFAGHMPGREGIDDYSAALDLLPELVAASVAATPRPTCTWSSPPETPKAGSSAPIGST